MLFSLDKNDELQWCWINYGSPYHTSSHTFFVQIDFHPRYLIVIFTFSATEFKDNLSLVIALAFIHIRILMFENILKPSSLNINGTQTNTHYVMSIVMDDNVFWMAYFFQYHSRIKKQIHQNRSDKREQQWNRPFFSKAPNFFSAFSWYRNKWKKNKRYGAHQCYNLFSSIDWARISNITLPYTDAKITLSDWDEWKLKWN